MTDEHGTMRAALKVGERAATRATLGLLRRELGLMAAMRVLVRVAWGRARGAPFAGLDAPADERDRLSRSQCGPAVLLFRAIGREVSESRALDITREVVVAGALPFLDAMVPPLSIEQLAEQGPALARRFFNAEGHARMDGDRALLFDVERCRFVELLDAVECRELAPLFCEVDRMFFDTKRRPVTLHRQLTIAGGDARCDFRFEPVDE